MRESGRRDGKERKQRRFGTRKGDKDKTKSMEEKVKEMEEEEKKMKEE